MSVVRSQSSFAKFVRSKGSFAPNESSFQSSFVAPIVCLQKEGRAFEPSVGQSYETLHDGILDRVYCVSLSLCVCVCGKEWHSVGRDSLETDRAWRANREV